MSSGDFSGGSGGEGGGGGWGGGGSGGASAGPAQRPARGAQKRTRASEAASNMHAYPVVAASEAAIAEGLGPVSPEKRQRGAGAPHAKHVCSLCGLGGGAMQPKARCLSEKAIETLRRHAVGWRGSCPACCRGGDKGRAYAAAVGLAELPGAPAKYHGGPSNTCVGGKFFLDNRCAPRCPLLCW